MELHLEIKALYDGEKQKLGEVYYDQSKMIKWKETCFKGF